MKRKLDTYFYQSQRAWIEDDAPLKILVKSRQTGFSWAKALRQHAARHRVSAGALLI